MRSSTSFRASIRSSCGPPVSAWHVPGAEGGRRSRVQSSRTDLALPRPPPPAAAAFPAEPAPRSSAVEEAEAWGEAISSRCPRRIFRWGTVRTRELRRVARRAVRDPAPDLAAFAQRAPRAPLRSRRAMRATSGPCDSAGAAGDARSGRRAGSRMAPSAGPSERRRLPDRQLDPGAARLSGPPAGARR